MHGETAAPPGTWRAHALCRRRHGLGPLCPQLSISLVHPRAPFQAALGPEAPKTRSGCRLASRAAWVFLRLPVTACPQEGCERPLRRCGVLPRVHSGADPLVWADHHLGFLLPRWLLIRDHL